MEVPEEINVFFDLPIHPAAAGTRQMLARDQASHRAFRKRHDPTLDIDLATVRKQASVLNPGVQLHTVLTLGDKEYKVTIDNMSSETNWASSVLSPNIALPTTAKKVMATPNELLSFAAASGLKNIARHRDTVRFQGIPLPDMEFLAASGDAPNMRSDVDGVFGIVREHDTSVSPELEAFAENIIGNFKVALFFRPPTEEDTDKNSWKLTAKLARDLSSLSRNVGFAPIIRRHPQYLYTDDLLFELGMTYGSGEVILRNAVGYYDPLRTFISIPTNAFEKYKKATGGVIDEATGLLIVTEEQYKNLETLKIEIGQANLDLVPNAQIWPRRMNNLLGGVPEKIYLGIVDSGVSSGPFDVVLGYTFFQRFLMVFDAIEEHKFGFGPNEYTYADLN